MRIKKSFICLIVAIQLTMIINTTIFGSNITWKTVKLPKIGQIELPSSMEIQTGKYKERSTKYSDKVYKEFGIQKPAVKVVIQPKDVNKLSSKSLKNYCRFIIEYDDKLSDPSLSFYKPINLSKDELDLFNSASKLIIKKGFDNYFKLNHTMKVISWQPVKEVKINSKYALKYEYMRQLDKNIPVHVSVYTFFSNDGGFRITLSYRTSEKNMWANDLKKMLFSLKFKNNNLNKNIYGSKLLWKTIIIKDIASIQVPQNLEIKRKKGITTTLEPSRNSSGNFDITHPFIVVSANTIKIPDNELQVLNTKKGDRIYLDYISAAYKNKLGSNIEKWIRSSVENIGGYKTFCINFIADQFNSGDVLYYQQLTFIINNNMVNLTFVFPPENKKEYKEIIDHIVKTLKFDKKLLQKKTQLPVFSKEQKTGNIEGTLLRGTEESMMFFYQVSNKDLSGARGLAFIIIIVLFAILNNCDLSSKIETSPYPNIGTGTGGWLLWLTLQILIGIPVVTLFILYKDYNILNQLLIALKMNYVTNAYINFKYFIIIDMIIKTVIGLILPIFSGILLLMGKRIGLILAKIILLVSLVISLMYILLMNGWVNPGLPKTVIQLNIEAIIQNFIAALLVFIIWFSYLSFSKRVKNTFPNKKTNF